MASNLKLSNTAVNTGIDAITALLNDGYLRIYDGTQAADAGTAIGSQVLLAELRFNATAFGAGSAGVATGNSITADASANNTGTATWFRALKSDGSTIVMDGNVNTTGADLNLNSTSITAGATVSVTSFLLTQPKA
jgi:hypothetical protein